MPIDFVRERIIAPVRERVVDPIRERVSPVIERVTDRGREIIERIRKGEEPEETPAKEVLDTQEINFIKQEKTTAKDIVERFKKGQSIRGTNIFENLLDYAGIEHTRDSQTNQIIVTKDPTESQKNRFVNEAGALAAGGVVGEYEPIPLRTQLEFAPTITDKARVIYEDLDRRLFGILPGGLKPSEAIGRAGQYQKRAEHYKVTKDILGDLTIDEITELAVLPGAKSFFSIRDEFNKNAVRDVLRDKYVEKIGNTMENEVNPQIQEIQQTYNERVDEVRELYNQGNITEEVGNKMLEEMGEQANKEAKKIQENWLENRGEALFDTATREIKDRDLWLNVRRSVRAPYLALTGVGIAGLGGVMGLAGAGAFGAKGVAVASGVKVVGYGLIAYSTLNLADNIVTLHEEDRLTKTNVIGTLAPTISYLMVGIPAGFAGAKFATKKLTAVTTEIQKGLTEQIVGNKALQKKIFTKQNLDRGYAEIPYGKLKIRVAVNQAFKQKVELADIALREGVVPEAKYVGKGATAEQFKEVGGALNEQLGINVVEGSLFKIRSELVSKITKTPMAKADWWSLRNVVDNRIVEVIFKMTKAGKITNPHLSVGTVNPQNRMVFFEVAKLIQTPRVVKAPIPGAPPLKVFSINVKPIARYIGTAKPGQARSITLGENKIIEVRKDDVLIKHLFGYRLGTEENFYQFLTQARLFPIKLKTTRGLLMEGKTLTRTMSYVDETGARRVFSIKGKLTGKDPPLELSVRNVPTKPKPFITPREITQISKAKIDTAQVKKITAQQNLNALKNQPQTPRVKNAIKTLQDRIKNFDKTIKTETKMIDQASKLLGLSVISKSQPTPDVAVAPAFVRPPTLKVTLPRTAPIQTFEPSIYAGLGMYEQQVGIPSPAQTLNQLTNQFARIESVVTSDFVAPDVRERALGDLTKISNEIQGLNLTKLNEKYVSEIEKLQDRDLKLLETQHKTKLKELQELQKLQLQRLVQLEQLQELRQLQQVQLTQLRQLQKTQYQQLQKLQKLQLQRLRQLLKQQLIKLVEVRNAIIKKIPLIKKLKIKIPFLKFPPFRFEFPPRRTPEIVEGQGYLALWFLDGKWNVISPVLNRNGAVYEGFTRTLRTPQVNRFRVRRVNFRRTAVIPGVEQPPIQLFKKTKTDRIGKTPVEEEWIQKKR